MMSAHKRIKMTILSLLLMVGLVVVVPAPASAAPYCWTPYAQANTSFYWYSYNIKGCGRVYTEYVNSTYVRVHLYGQKWHDELYDQSKVCLETYNLKPGEGWRQRSSLCDTNSVNWSPSGGYVLAHHSEVSGMQFRLATYRWDGYTATYIPVSQGSWPYWTLAV